MLKIFVGGHEGGCRKPASDLPYRLLEGMYRSFALLIPGD
jgi:hypothetical protein